VPVGPVDFDASSRWPRGSRLEHWGDHHAWARRARDQERSIPLVLETPDFQAQVIERPVDERPPLLQNGRGGLQDRHPFVALVTQLIDADQLEIPHPHLRLRNPLLEVLRADVEEHGGVGLGVVDLLQRSEAVVECGSVLLLHLDLDDGRRGGSNLGPHRLLQLVDADLHRGIPLLTSALAVGGALLHVTTLLIDGVEAA
jgi:hypothetical protein